MTNYFKISEKVHLISKNYIFIFILLSNFVWKVEFLIGGAPTVRSAPKTLRSAQCGHEVQYVLFIKTFYPGRGVAFEQEGEEIKRITLPQSS